jgi:hypothetical protein
MLPAGELNPVHITCVESALAGGQPRRYSAYRPVTLCLGLCRFELDGCGQSMLIATHWVDGSNDSLWSRRRRLQRRRL